MKNRLINYIIGRISHLVLPESIITIDKGVIKIGGEVITENELKQMQAEVKALEGFRVWNLMTNSVRKIAVDRIVNQSTNFQEVMDGKLMLLNLDTIESIARVIKNKK